MARPPESRGTVRRDAAKRAREGLSSTVPHLFSQEVEAGGGCKSEQGRLQLPPLRNQPGVSLATATASDEKAGRAGHRFDRLCFARRGSIAGGSSRRGDWGTVTRGRGGP